MTPLLREAPREPTVGPRIASSPCAEAHRSKGARLMLPWELGHFAEAAFTTCGRVIGTVAKRSSGTDRRGSLRRRQRAVTLPSAAWDSKARPRAVASARFRGRVADGARRGREMARSAAGALANGRDAAWRSCTRSGVQAAVARVGLERVQRDVADLQPQRDRTHVPAEQQLAALAVGLDEADEQGCVPVGLAGARVYESIPAPGSEHSPRWRCCPSRRSASPRPARRR